MNEMKSLLDKIYHGQDRMSRAEIYYRALVAQLPPPQLTRLELLPDGEYSADEVLAALTTLSLEPDPQLRVELGVPGADLTDDDLIRELAQLHRTRHETLRHASGQALVRHTDRLGELESEYITRFPAREVEADRLRAGARNRS